MPRLLLCVLCLVLTSVPAQAQRLISGSRVLVGTLNYCEDVGSTDAYACNLLETIVAYGTGTRYTFKANTANTGSATLNLNSLGATPLKKMTGGITTDLEDNDIRAGQLVDVIYDGANLQMLSQVSRGTQTIASGSIALATSAISSGACATEQTATATGVVTTDAVIASFNGDVTGVTGFTPATTGTLRLDVYPKSGQIGLRVCNATASSITPGSATLNWRVVR